jgi:hypothetical protein
MARNAMTQRIDRQREDHGQHQPEQRTSCPHWRMLVGPSLRKKIKARMSSLLSASTRCQRDNVSMSGHQLPRTDRPAIRRRQQEQLGRQCRNRRDRQVRARQLHDQPLYHRLAVDRADGSMASCRSTSKKDFTVIAVRRT